MSDETIVVSTPEVESSSVSELTPTVETETPAVEPETTEVATLEQPGEDKAEGGRAAERIRRLAREKKAAEEQATYWKTLAEAQNAPEPPTYQQDSDSEFATVDQIAEAASQRIEHKLNARELAKRAQEAKAQLKADIEETIEQYPELDTDDDLAQEVHVVAQGLGITYKAAATRVLGRRDQAAKIAEARAIATDATRASVSAPELRGAPEVTPDVIHYAALTEAERNERWSEILQAAQEGRLR